MRKALVLGLIAALGLSCAAFAQGELSGSWDTDITIDPAATNIQDFLDFSTVLTVIYSVGGWDFTSVSTLDDTGWTDQTFAAAGSFGVFNMNSLLDFGTDGTFDKWTLGTSFLFGSVDLDFDFVLENGDLALTIGMGATTGLVTFDVDVSFGTPDNDLCDFNWQGVDITIDFPFCCAEVTATIAINCDGFEKACFAVSDIVVPGFPWFGLDAEVCFELETKTLTLSPDFDFGADLCFDVYMCATSDGGVLPWGSPLQLLDIYIAGIGLECEVGAVTFTGISFWGEQCTKPTALGDYWEMYKISSTDDACCGPFTFDIAVFFDETSGFLFDVAAFEADFSYDLGDALTFTMGLDYTAASGLTLWTIGFEITW
jgi:hypothetical protein